MFNHTNQTDGARSRCATTYQTDRLYIGGGQSGVANLPGTVERPQVERNGTKWNDGGTATDSEAQKITCTWSEPPSLDELVRLLEAPRYWFTSEAVRAAHHWQRVRGMNAGADQMADALTRGAIAVAISAGRYAGSPAGAECGRWAAMPREILHHLRALMAAKAMP
jgi:hypothetical protein